jgi:formylglycine-generating enzyme required for sulfatase activity
MKLHPWIFGALAALLFACGTDAAPIYDLATSIVVYGNSVDGFEGPRCDASTDLVTGKQTEWWITVGEARPNPSAAGWEGVGSAIQCGNGSAAGPAADAGSSSRTPYLTATVSLNAAVDPSRWGPERVLRVNVSISVRKLADFSATGVPTYQQSTEKRSFFFQESGTAFLPLIVAGDKERAAFKLREALIGIRAGLTEKNAGAAYGAVSVSSELDGAELRLDGGLVGRIVAGKETELDNVLVGDREVSVHDASGRAAYRVVRVERHRTAMVSINLPDPVRDAASYRIVPLGKNAEGYAEFERRRDGAVVVRIPAGEFLMGNRLTEGQPLEHMVELTEGYLMDKNPVTWSQFKKFAGATGTSLPPDPPYWGIHDDHPASFVTWEEAKAYCEWAGGRLPTEAEREKAARGTDGRKFPWGNQEPDPRRAVFRRNWGEAATDPVGTHPSGASPYGLLDMGGHMWEWVADWWDAKYFEVSPRRDPKGPRSGNAHVVKGGSWDSRPTVLSASSRNFGYRGYREGDFGFRCAMDHPADQ